jgi:hypothetical protein
VAEKKIRPERTMEIPESKKKRKGVIKGVKKLTWGRQVRENPLHLTPYD